MSDNLTIYSVWYSKTCSLEYFKTKGSAQQKAKEYIVDYCLENNSPECMEELYDSLIKNNVASIDELFEIVAIDEIEVNN